MSGQYWDRGDERGERAFDDNAKGLFPVAMLTVRKYQRKLGRATPLPERMMTRSFPRSGVIGTRAVVAD